MEEVAIRVRLDTGDSASKANELAEALGNLEAKFGTSGSGAVLGGDVRGLAEFKATQQAIPAAPAPAASGAGRPEAPDVVRTGPSTRVEATALESAMKRALGGLSSTVGMLGQGNLAGAAVGAADDAGGLLSMLGKSGALKGGLVAGAVVGGIAAVGAAGNKLASLWENMARPSMELTAVLGGLSGDAKKNSAAFLRNFNAAGAAAAKFGYSLEDGIFTAIELGRTGAYKKGDSSVFGAEERVLAYQRGTGAERSTLIEAEALSHRFGLGDKALGYAYGGTLASGMDTGRFNEYLNATLRVFEDGLSKGVVKGFGEVTRAQNFMAALGGGSELWKGERGAERLEKMNRRLESQTDLEGEYSVISYKAMENTLNEARLHGYKDDETGKWSEFKKYSTDFIDPRTGGKVDYGFINNFRAEEGGFTPEFFSNYMKILENQVSGGDSVTTVLGIQKGLGLSYNDAVRMFEAYAKGDYSKVSDVYEKAPKGNSTEERLYGLTEEIRQDVYNISSNVLPLKEGALKGLGTITMALAGDRAVKNAEAVVGGVLGQSSEAGLARSFSGLLGKSIREGSTDEATHAYSILDKLSGLDPLKRNYLDVTGVLNGQIAHMDRGSLRSFDKLLDSMWGLPSVKESFQAYKAMVDRQDDKGAGAAFAAAVPKSYREPEVGYGFGGKKQVRPGGTFHTELSAEAAKGADWAKVLQSDIWNLTDKNGFFGAVGGSKALKAAEEAMAAGRLPDSPGGKAISEEEGWRIVATVMKDFIPRFEAAADKYLKAAQVTNDIKVFVEDGLR